MEIFLQKKYNIEETHKHKIYNELQQHKKKSADFFSNQRIKNRQNAQKKLSLQENRITYVQALLFQAVPYQSLPRWQPFAKAKDGTVSFVNFLPSG